MALVGGVHKVLNLAHGELSDADEAGAGRDLVAEGSSDLRRRERQFPLE